MSKTPIEQLLDSINYSSTGAEPNKEGLPYVTHEGLLNLGDIQIRVCILNTGQRIIADDEFDRLFGFTPAKGG